VPEHVQVLILDEGVAPKWRFDRIDVHYWLYKVFNSTRQLSGSDSHVIGEFTAYFLQADYKQT
jgi:hypothetical protein